MRTPLWARRLAPSSAETAGSSTTVSADSPPVPARLTPAEVRRGLRISMIEGAVATAHLSVTGAVGGSVFLTGFAMLLGANSFQLGVLGALPFIGQLAQFVGAYLEERAGKRRALVLFGALAGRMLWALLLTLPFLGALGPGGQLAVFFIGLACSYAFNGIASNAWLSWMSDLVPPRERGSYFGMRNTVASLSAMATTFAAGRALDAFRAAGDERLGYAVIFGLALIPAAGAAMLIARQPEPPLAPKGRVKLGDLLGGPLHDARFRSYVLVATGWTLATGVAAPFFNAYGLSTLKLSFSALALQAIVTSGVALVFGPIVGKLQDRYGYRLVMTLCILGTVPLPWGWVLSTPDNILPLWLTSIFSGVFWPGVNQGISNVLMERAPANQRGPAMAAFSAITGLGTLVAGLLGGALVGALATTQIGLGPLAIGGMATVFVLSSLGRLAIAGVFWRTL